MMIKHVILCIFLVCVFSADTEFKLPVKAQTQEKLSLSLDRLAEQLQFFRTPYENKTNLYKRVALVQQYLQEVNDQVCQYNNVLIGQSNRIDGSKNVIVGSYNSIRGSNNYVFIEKYTGQANGDLLLGKWRIEIQKKRSILVNATLAISFINEETNRKYLRFLSQNKVFSYGSTSSDNTVTVIREEDAAPSQYLYGVSNPSTQAPSYGSTYSASSSVPVQQSSFSYGGSSYGYGSVAQTDFTSSRYNTDIRSSSSQSTQSPQVYQSKRNSDQLVSSLASLNSNKVGTAQNVQVSNTGYQSYNPKVVQQVSSPVYQQAASNVLNGLNTVGQMSSFSTSGNLRSQPDTTQVNIANSRYYRSSSSYTQPSTPNYGSVASSFNIQPQPSNLASWRGRY